jgi:hypothetical protein
MLTEAVTYLAYMTANKINLLRSCIYAGVLTAPVVVSAQPFSAAINVHPDATLGYALNTADLDNDGLIDVIAGVEAGTVWYRALGDGTYAPTILMAHPVGPANNILLADVDQNGSLDVIQSMDNTNMLYVLYGIGGGAFSEPQFLYGATDIILTTALADLDGDGDLDLVTNYASGAIYLFVNLGGILDTQPQLVATLPPGYSTELSVGDINGDGTPDLITKADNEVGLIANDGMGTLSAHVPILSPSMLIHLSLGDLDADGDLDIVLSRGSLFMQVHRYLNDGTGSFSSAGSVTPGEFDIGGIQIADLDADGANDIIYGSFFEHRIWHQLNMGNGLFAPPELITSSALGVYALHAVDMDGDGDVDVLSSSGPDSRVSWYENLSTALSTAQQSPPTVLSMAPLPLVHHSILQAKDWQATADLRITDLTGREIRRDRVDLRTGSVRIERNGLHAGLYVLELSDGQRKRTITFTVE